MNDESIVTRLDEALTEAFDTSKSIESRSARLRQLRRDDTLAARFDSAVLERDALRDRSVSRLQNMLNEVRAAAEKLASPPFQEGVFVETAEHEGRQLARVAMRGGVEMLLEVVDEQLLGSLNRGDRVVLSSQGNVVLARSGSPQGPGELAPVERWLEPGRLVVRYQEQPRVLRCAEGLQPQTVQEGDLVRIDPACAFAMERVAPPAPRCAYEASEDAPLPPESMAGYDELRDAVLGVTGLMARPDMARRYGLRRPGRILLSGRPGCGKTTLARVIAHEIRRLSGSHCRIRKVNGAETLSSFVGATEERIRTLVRECHAGPDWTLLFLDEADAIGRARGVEGAHHGDRFLNSWLAELEGFDGQEGSKCLVVAATNQPALLDPAFRSRFSTEIAIPPPRMDSARSILSLHLPEDLPFHPGPGPMATRTRQAAIESALAKLYLPGAPGALIATLKYRDGTQREVFSRDLCSGRLLAQIADDAKKSAMLREIEGGSACVGLTSEDIDAAVDAARDRMRQTLTVANADRYLELDGRVGLVAVEAAPSARSGITFIHEAAR